MSDGFLVLDIETLNLDLGEGVMFGDSKGWKISTLCLTCSSNLFVLIMNVFLEVSIYHQLSMN